MKRKHDKDTDSDTSGGETWTFSGDDSHFSWCYDTFDETKNVYKDYEPDSAGSPNVEDAYGDDGRDDSVFIKHRLRNLSPREYDFYCYTFQNAKRIKNDKFIEINNDTFYFNGRYIGDNSKVVHDLYNEADYINTINSQEA
ncbi:MAG: hypothetical protein IKP65_04305 [Alphaproteobacteria bacterium]|nr:hypothetical protein [Alphaproteobacteria bacterium]